MNRECTVRPVTGLEICCGDIMSVEAALKGGARRIELCSALSEGGLTPSAGLIRAAVATGMPEVNVLIRPRPGDFLYSAAELRIMEADIREAVAAGATGVVIGVLDASGNVDTSACRLLISAARSATSRNVNITFHRAFDVAASPDESLERIIALQCDCLLTSGMAPDAMAGAGLIRDMRSLAAGRIAIMAGAGVNPRNAEAVIMATGADLIHSTARDTLPSAMRFRRTGIPMGAPGDDEYSRRLTSASIVTRLLEITRSI